MVQGIQCPDTQGILVASMVRNYVDGPVDAGDIGTSHTRMDNPILKQTSQSPGFSTVWNTHIRYIPAFSSMNVPKLRIANRRPFLLTILLKKPHKPPLCFL